MRTLAGLRLETASTSFASTAIWTLSSSFVSASSSAAFGGVTSMITASAAEDGDRLPAASAAIAVIPCTPSDSGTLETNDQLPAPSAVVEPKNPSTSLKTSIVAPGSAVPFNFGWRTLVMLSVLETPESLAGSRSGAGGMLGGVVSSTAAAVAGCPSLPTASVSVTDNVNTPSASARRSTEETACAASSSMVPDPVTGIPPPLDEIE